jgi:polar amino acid transport system substrate-binding protein
MPTRPITVLLVALLTLALALAASAPQGAEPVRLATLEWPPYVGRELPDQGYVAAVARAAFAEQGLALEIEFHPWERALELARSGAVDGLMPEYFNMQREAEFEYSAAFPGGPLVLYRRSDADIRFAADPMREPERALRALQAYRFGVVRGYVNSAAFDAADYLMKLPADDDEDNLRKLVAGEIDLAVIDRHVAEHLIASRHPDYAGKIAAMSPPLAEPPLYVAFSRKAAQHRALVAFDRGLAALAADGRLAELHRHHFAPDSPRR